jgi:hypothetical protein
VKHVPSDYYDLAPDGERVPVLMPVETQEAQGQKPRHLPMNFFDELRRPGGQVIQSHD